MFIRDRFYSYTPSMNSLAAMARGTVVIGGGEEEYYEFIGETELRPIIMIVILHSIVFWFMPNGSTKYLA